MLSHIAAACFMNMWPCDVDPRWCHPLASWWYSVCLLLSARVFFLCSASGLHRKVSAVISSQELYCSVWPHVTLRRWQRTFWTCSMEANCIIKTTPSYTYIYRLLTSTQRNEGIWWDIDKILKISFVEHYTLLSIKHLPLNRLADCSVLLSNDYMIECLIQHYSSTSYFSSELTGW